MQDASVVVVPGLGGSSPGHWQSIWQAQHPAWVRSTPASWDEPDSDDWDRAVHDMLMVVPKEIAHLLLGRTKPKAKKKVAAKA